MSYFYVFLQSCLLEVPLYLLIMNRKRITETFVFIFAMNSITHPIVFFGLMNLPLTYLQNILIAETFAVVSETIFLISTMKASFSRAFWASFLANLVSWQVGPMLTYFVWG